MAGPTFSAVAFAAPTGGEAPSLPPDQLGPTRAQRLQNFLVHQPGRIIPRGNIGPISGSLLNADGATLLATIPIDYEIITSYRALNGPPANATYPMTDPWRVPIHRTQAEVDLSQPALGPTAIGILNTKTGTETFMEATDPLQIPGPSHCRVNEAVYAASFGGPIEAIAIDGGIPIAVHLNAVWKFNRGGPSVNNGPLLNGPRIVQGVFSHYGRVWAAAARAPGGAAGTYDTSTIYYTVPGGTAAQDVDTVADWTDPVTGELNVISVGAKNDGDFVLGFGRAAGHLVIFKRYSVWILYGTSPANFTLRQLRAQNGCVDPRSIAVCDEGVYFASQRGFELFDGSRFTLLSAPVADQWLPVSNAGAAASGNNHAFIRADPLPNDYLYVAMGTDRHIPGSATDRTVYGWLLHRPSGAWVDCRTNIAGMGLGPSGHLNRLVYTGNSVIAFGDRGHYAFANDLPYGTDVLGFHDSHGGTDYNVDLVWRSRVDNIGGAWAAATLQRAAVDYRQEYTPAASSAAAWGTAAILDGTGAVLSPAFGLPAAISPGPRRSRPVRDIREESPAGDAVVEISSAIGAAATQRHQRLAIHGASVGFRVGYERTRS